MITVKFYRFAPEGALNTETYLFQTSLDHIFSSDLSACSFEEATKLATNWLKDHYGKCLIYVDEFSGQAKFHAKISNKQQMKKELNGMGMSIVIK